MLDEDAPDEILSSVVALGRAMFGAAACSLALLEPAEEHLVFRAADGAGAGEVVGLRLPISRGIAGWVVSSGQPIVVHEVRADPRFARDVAESTGYVPTSIMAMPVETPRALLGVIEVLDRTHTDDRDDLELLRGGRHHISAAVGRCVRRRRELTPPKATQGWPPPVRAGATTWRSPAGGASSF